MTWDGDGSGRLQNDGRTMMDQAKRRLEDGCPVSSTQQSVEVRYHLMQCWLEHPKGEGAHIEPCCRACLT